MSDSMRRGASFVPMKLPVLALERPQFEMCGAVQAFDPTEERSVR